MLGREMYSYCQAHFDTLEKQNTRRNALVKLYYLLKVTKYIHALSILGSTGLIN